jgi:hypothetical protein
MMAAVIQHLVVVLKLFMVNLFLIIGLRESEKAAVLGAQTVRQGMVGPGRDLLAGETSPAVFFKYRRSEPTKS